MMSSHFYQLLIFSLYILKTSSQQIVCTNDNQCSTTTLEGDRIFCNGYESCRASTLISSGTGNNIHCDGMRACQNSVITMSTSGTTDIIIRNNGLWGHLGGKFKFSDGIHARSFYYSGGYLSSQNAEIHSGKNNRYVYMWLYGYKSGENLSFYCESGTKCILRCGLGSCVNTNFYCDSGSTSCSYSCDDNDHCNVNYIVSPTQAPTQKPISLFNRLQPEDNRVDDMGFVQEDKDPLDAIPMPPLDIY